MVIAVATKTRKAKLDTIPAICSGALSFSYLLDVVKTSVYRMECSTTIKKVTQPASWCRLLSLSCE